MKEVPDEITDLGVALKLVCLANSAKKRDLEFSLTFRKVKKLVATTRCYFTGVELNRVNEDPNQRSIDRLDNSIGYTDDNTVACARSFNQNVKRDLTVEQIEQMYKGLKKAKLCK